MPSGSSPRRAGSADQLRASSSRSCARSASGSSSELAERDAQAEARRREADSSWPARHRRRRQMLASFEQATQLADPGRRAHAHHHRRCSSRRSGDEDADERDASAAA